MNPYAIRGWTLPSTYGEGSSCDRGSLYAPWTSGYFAGAPVYSVPGGENAGKLQNGMELWKPQPDCVQGSLATLDVKDVVACQKEASDGMYAKPCAVRSQTDCFKEENQRNYCAFSCNYAGQQRLSSMDTAWTATDVPNPVDFHKGMVQFQGLYPRDIQSSIHLPSCSMTFPTVALRKRRRPYTKFQLSELEREYKSTTYVSKARRWEMSQMVSLSERQIKIWFQNRRIKAKKTAKKDEGVNKS